MALSISIIIPVYNEAQRIPKNLKKIFRYFQNDDYEVIVVDDGSTDHTAEVVRSLANDKTRILRNQVNMGKGFSVKKGVLAASKKLILFSDADLSTPISELKKLLPFVKTHDVIIGSRALSDSQVRVRQSFYKVLLGRIGNLLIRLLAVKGIRDTQCGFKLFHKKTKYLFEKLTICRWGFDFELLYLVQKTGLSIKEVPVIWINDTRSKVKKIDYLITLLDLIKIRINNLFGRYK